MLSGCHEVLENFGFSGEEEERTFMGLSAPEGPELVSSETSQCVLTGTARS